MFKGKLMKYYVGFCDVCQSDMLFEKYHEESTIHCPLFGKEDKMHVNVGFGMAAAAG